VTQFGLIYLSLGSERVVLSSVKLYAYEDALGTKLLVAGLPPLFSTQELKDLFAPFGTVLSASVITDLAGTSLRTGEVEMSTPQEAETAMRTLHRSHIQGEILLVFE